MKVSEIFEQACREPIVAKAIQDTKKCVLVPKEWLPPEYQQKRDYRSLSSIENQHRRENKKQYRDQRDVSVKFDSSQNVTSCTQARLDQINAYRDMVDEQLETPIEYNENERKLYLNQVAFAKLGIESGMFAEDEFDVA
jgi:hypothetical protein